MIPILDRYTLREILPPFMLALLVFTFMLMMGPLDREAKELLAKGVEGSVILRMLVTLVPQALAVTIPMAFLLGLLVAFGRLSGDSEWVAMQACGVTLLRMLRPVLALALVSSAATLWVMIDAVPRANQAFREITYRVIAQRVESEIKPRIFYADFPEIVVYPRDTAPGGQGWSDVFVADTRQAGPPLVTVARSGRMVLERPTRSDEAGKVEMVLEDRVTYHMGIDAAGRALLEQGVSQGVRMTLDPDQVFPRGTPLKGEPEKTVGELRQSIAELKRDGKPTDRPEYYIHLKFSIPVACLVFALMGLGFGVSTSRGGKLAAFALGSGVIFAYYVVMYQARSLSLGGLWPAWFAAWLPNILLGPAGAWVVYKRARSSGSSFQIAVPAVGFLRRFLPARAAADSATGPSAVRPVLVIRFPRFWLPRPGILDLYISKMYLRLQALTFASLLGIFYISQFIDLSDKLFRGSATAGLMLWFFVYKTPQFIYFIIPLSVLIATLVTVGALTRNSELIVMRACGISLYRAAFPLVVLAACSSLLLFGIEEYALAPSNRQAQDLDNLIRHGTPRQLNRLNRRWIAARNGDIYHYEFFDERRGTLVGFWKYELDQRNWRLTRITFAERVHFERPSTTPDSPAGTWTTGPGWVREIASETASTYTPFASRRLAMESPEYFGAVQPEAASMTYAELSDYVDVMSSAGHNILQYLVDLHRKIAFPFVTIVMSLLAIPFAATTGRRGALYGIGVGIVLAIVYWTSNNLFGVVGATGLLTPMLAAWAPNLLFGAGAAYLILTVRT